MMSHHKSAKMLHTYKSTIHKHTPNAYTPTFIYHIDYLITPYCQQHSNTVRNYSTSYNTEIDQSPLTTQKLISPLEKNLKGLTIRLQKQIKQRFFLHKHTLIN